MMQDVETKEMNSKQFFSRFGLLYFVGSVVTIGIQFLAIGLARQFKPEWMDNGNLVMLVNYIPLILIAYPLFLFLLDKYVPKAPKIEEKKMTLGQGIVAFIMSYSILYIGNIIGTIATGIIGSITGNPVQNAVIQMLDRLSVVLQLVIVVIIAPMFEELIFRKFLIDRTIRYGEGCAIAISGIFFCLFHGNFSQGFYALGMGLFFGFIYVKTGRVRYTMFLHMAINFVGSVVAMKVVGLIDVAKIQELLNAGDMDAYMQYVMDNMAGLAIYAGYVICVFIVAIVGVILFIVSRKKFRLVPVNAPIPKGERFKTIFLNPGMILMCLVWIGMYIYSVVA